MTHANMTLITTVRTYLRLFRFHAVAQEAIFPLFGLLIVGDRNFLDLVLVFFIGLLFHIYTHVLNEYIDIDIDKTSIDLKDKPLVSGSISKKTALYISIIACISTYILTILYFRTFYALLFLTFATILGALYDLYAKKIPGVSDIIMGSTFCFFFFFGVGIASATFPIFVIIVGMLIFFGVLLVNIVEGGLKDVDHDYIAGGKTVAILLGVKVVDQRLVVSKKFAAFTWSILGLILMLFVWLFLQPEINSHGIDSVKMLITVFLILIILACAYRFLYMKKYDRTSIKRQYFMMNTTAGLLFVISLYPLFGFEAAIILIIFPISWYLIFNTLLYGHPIQPKI
jgi:4-hydroxybenzoate polyprenyltransferase